MLERLQKIRTPTLAVVLGALVWWLPISLAETGPTLGIRENTPRNVAFTDATVVVAPGEIVEGATLVVEDGRVAAVGQDVSVPSDIPTIALEGRWIFPGFIDVYTEYGLPETEDSRGRRRREPIDERQRSGAVAWNDAIHAEREWVAEFEPDAKAAEAFLERGVTVVQSAKKDGVFRGRAFVATLAEGSANEVVVTPRGLHLGAFDKGTSEQSYPSSLMGSIALVRQTLYDARWYGEASKSGEGRPEANLALEALAANEGPILFESEDELELLRAGRISKELGVEFIHLGSHGEYRRLGEVAALGQRIVLPLHFPDKPEVGTWEDELGVSLSDLRHWERAPWNPAALAERGVEFAFTGHGLGKKDDFFDPLREVVEHGLEPRVALAALTTVPAEILGLGGELGTLEPGKRASFSIASGDLLSDEDADLFQVWIDGRLAKEFETLDAFDFEGRYALELEGSAYELEIKKRFGKRLGGQLSKGEEKVRLGDVEAEGGRLDFHADLAELGGGGLARFTLVGAAESVTGRALLAEGGRAAFDLERLPGEEGEEDAAEEPDPKALVSRLTHPSAAFGFAEVPEARDVLVRGATIWTSGPGGVLENADLLVRDGEIAAVGQGLEAPSGVEVIDGSGKHVTAGIIDEHSHLAISGGVNEGSLAVSAEVRIGDVVDPDDVGIYRALAGGVTSAQLLHGSSNPIGGQAQVIKMRWGSSAEELKFEGAPPTIKFALGENVKQSNWGDRFTTRYPQTRMGVETLIKDRFLEAREYAAEHAAWEALSEAEREGRTAPRRNLQLEALAEILAGERFTHVHSYVQSEILMLMRLAEELGFTIQTFTHILEGYKVAPEMAEHGAGGSTFSDWWAYKFEVYDAIPYNPCLMHEAGVVTSINSDSAEMIRRLNQEAAKSVTYCGMEEAEALEMVTLYPAQQLKIDDRVGSLEVGKDADFVLWNGHPLSMYSKVEATWVDGAQLFSLERDAELREAAREEKRALVEKALRSRDEKGRWGEGENGWGRSRERKLWHCEDVEDYWHAQAR